MDFIDAMFSLIMYAFICAVIMLCPIVGLLLLWLVDKHMG